MEFNKVYYIESTEEYLLEKKVKSIIKDFEKSNGSLNISKCNIRNFVDEVLTYPFMMMGDKRLVILDNLSEKDSETDYIEEIIKTLQDLPDFVVLLIIGPLDKRKKLYKALTKLNNETKLDEKLLEEVFTSLEKNEELNLDAKGLKGAQLTKIKNLEKTKELVDWVLGEFKNLNLKNCKSALKQIGVIDKDIVKFELFKLSKLEDSVNENNIKNTLKNRQLLQIIPVQKEIDIINWMLSEEDFKSLKLNKNSCKIILGRTGISNMYNIKNETLKLVELEKGVNKEIVDQVILKSIEANGFDLTNALVKRDKTTAYKIIKELEHDDTSYIGLLSLANKNFATIKMLQEGYNLKEITNLGIHEYSAKTLKPLSNLFSKTEIINALELTKIIDAKMKSGENKKMLMEQLVASI